MKRKAVCNGRMIEKDVTGDCLQRKDDREGYNGRMPEKDVMEGGSSFKATKEGGGYSVPDVIAPRD